MDDRVKRPDLDRLRKPIPWRPALQLSDTGGYALPKPVLRALIETAVRPRRH